MSYVPTPIYTPPPDPPSPRVRELHGQLRSVIDRYRVEHPELSDREVLQALGLARQGLAGSTATRRAALGAGIGIMVGVTFVVVALGGGSIGAEGLPIIGIALVVVVIGLVLAILKAPK